MVYHPGRVLKVFRNRAAKKADVQATIGFWDMNTHTLKVEPGIAARIKEGDIVLVDYYPHERSPQAKRLIVAKILDKKDGAEIWSHYTEMFKRRRVKRGAPVQEPQDEHSYVG